MKTKLTDLTDSGLKAMGQETLVFKACWQDALSPGYPMNISGPESCCAHIEPNESARAAAYMLHNPAMMKFQSTTALQLLRYDGKTTVCMYCCSR